MNNTVECTYGWHETGTAAQWFYDTEGRGRVYMCADCYEYAGVVLKAYCEPLHSALVTEELDLVASPDKGDEYVCTYITEDGYHSARAVYHAGYVHQAMAMHNAAMPERKEYVIGWESPEGIKFHMHDPKLTMDQV